MSEKTWWTLLLLATPLLYIVTFPFVEPLLIDLVYSPLAFNDEAREILRKTYDAYEAPMDALTWLMGYR
jgi:hypothetical protein